MEKTFKGNDLYEEDYKPDSLSSWNDKPDQVWCLIVPNPDQVLHRLQRKWQIQHHKSVNTLTSRWIDISREINQIIFCRIYTKSAKSDFAGNAANISCSTIQFASAFRWCALFSICIRWFFHNCFKKVISLYCILKYFSILWIFRSPIGNV